MQTSLKQVDMTSKGHAKGLAKWQADAQNARKRVTPQGSKKMPLVSGMMPGDSRSALGIEKMTNIDKADALVKRVVRAISLAEIQPGASGGFTRLDDVGLQRF